jgi:hypothetical protein
VLKFVEPCSKAAQIFFAKGGFVTVKGDFSVISVKRRGQRYEIVLLNTQQASLFPRGECSALFSIPKGGAAMNRVAFSGIIALFMPRHPA